jgi:predicted O-methyltransferase YrrM
MTDTIHRLKEFLSYQQRAQTKYYIHSPFVYQFYLHILESQASDQPPDIHLLRKKLLQNYNKISITDMGADPGEKKKTISQIASKSSIPSKYGTVLLHLVQYYSPTEIIELGTCLGIGTSYLAIADPASRITTIEGSKALTDIAAENFATLKFNNIRQVTGHFDVKLPEVLDGLSKVDLAYIDGNHRYEPTLQYFNLLMEKAHEGCILVFDDIYWSREMTAAWTAIKKDPRISLTIDIYRFGIAFMHRDKLAKEDFTLRY